eukprot:jgi/Astpho2/8703/Aster-05270
MLLQPSCACGGSTTSEAFAASRQGLLSRGRAALRQLRAAGGRAQPSRTASCRCSGSLEGSGNSQQTPHSVEELLRKQMQQASEVDRKMSLLRLVQNAEPEKSMADFTRDGPPYVVEAMEKAISNLLGNLPQRYFAVSVSMRTEDLAELMWTLMRTGLMFRNAVYRMACWDKYLPSGDDFDGWHDAPHLPIMTMQEYDDSASYAEGTQKKVSGEVIRWHHKTGPVRVPAEQHIQALENEVKVLKQQRATQLYIHAAGSNRLLDYIKGLPHAQIETIRAPSDEFIEASNSLIHTLLGTEAGNQDQFEAPCEASSLELGRIFYYLLIMGWSLREHEVNLDFEQALCLPSVAS